MTAQNKPFLFFFFFLCFSIFFCLNSSADAQALEIYGNPDGYCDCPSGGGGGGSGYSGTGISEHSTANMIIVHSYILVTSRTEVSPGGFQSFPKEQTSSGASQICFNHILHERRDTGEDLGDGSGFASYDKYTATRNGASISVSGNHCYSSGVSGTIQPGQGTGQICEKAYYSPSVSHTISHYFPPDGIGNWDDGYTCGDGWSSACGGYFREAEAVFGSELSLTATATFDSGNKSIIARDAPALPTSNPPYYQSTVTNYMNASGDTPRISQDESYDLPSIMAVNNFKDAGTIYMGSELTDAVNLNLKTTINRGIDTTYDSIFSTGQIKTPYTVATQTPVINNPSGETKTSGGDFYSEMTTSLRDSKQYYSSAVKNDNFKLCNSNKADDCTDIIGLGTKNATYIQSGITAGRAEIKYGGLNIPEYIGVGAKISFNRPYNFDLTSFYNEFASSTEGAIYPGAKISVKASTTNNNKKGDVPHSYTPANTTIRTFLFVLDKNYIPEPSQTTGEGNIFASYTHYGDGDGVCSHYSNSIGSYKFCDKLNEVVFDDGIAPNDTKTLSSEYTTAPDLEVGDKICIVSEINFVDSTLNDGYNFVDGLVSDNNSNSWYAHQQSTWYATSANCEVVRIRPTTQIWGGDMSASGDVEGIPTSVNEKTEVEGEIGTLNTFGSWVDYGIIAGSSLKNFASGSAGATGISSYTNCSISPLSIANKNCELGDLGYSGVTVSKSFAEKVISRYHGISTCSELGLCAPISSSIAGSTSTNLYRIDGVVNDSGLQVYYVPEGDVYINGDIKLQERTFEKVSDIPQNIIIAEKGNVFVAENVTEIDAWIIAPNGTLNTCVGTLSGASVQTYTVADKTLSSDVCGNQLIVRGPVAVKKVLPYRTYANAESLATPSSQSNANIERASSYAERFVLPYSSLIWSFSESTNKSSSIDTVYTRELAPRI